MHRKMFVALLMAALCLSWTIGCANREVRMNTAADQPAATGKAEIETDDNGNTVVNLKVDHLARPENLSPPKSVYVVWFEPRGEAAVNQGALRVNDNLEGEFKGRTPYKNFDVFVTAEDNATVQTPTGTEVMRQQVQR